MHSAFAVDVYCRQFFANLLATGDRNQAADHKLLFMLNQINVYYLDSTHIERAFSKPTNLTSSGFIYLGVNGTSYTIEYVLFKKERIVSTTQNYLKCEHNHLGSTIT